MGSRQALKVSRQKLRGLGMVKSRRSLILVSNFIFVLNMQKEEECHA